MKKIVLFGTILLFGLNSCSNKENVYVPENIDGEFTFYKSSDLKENISFIFSPNNKDIKVKFEAFVVNDVLYSTLSFSEKFSSWNVLSKFKNEIKDNNFTENMYLAVKTEANTIKQNLPYEKIRNIDNILDAIPEKLFNKVSREEYYKDSSLSLFYHLGSLKSAKRSFENRTTHCDCSFYANSFDEKSPFFCEEDKPINATSVLNIVKDITENKKFAGKIFNASKTINYLEKNKDKFLSASKIDRLIKDEFMLFLDEKITQKELRSLLPKKEYNNLEIQAFNTMTNSEIIGGDFPYDPSCLIYGARQGSDCGCCSNYSGPCYFCSVVCYAHDHACTECGWYCGWKCVPGPCKN